jgi:hypothetical protein
MLDKQSKILKKGTKLSKEVEKKITKKVAKTGIKKEAHAKLPDHHFKVVKVKRGLAGLGLFAGEDIKKGEMIIEYIGTILDKAGVDKIKTNQYLFEINRNKTIDGSVRWNIARYCNHACEEAANAESEIKKGRVFIQAIKLIKSGDEIVYDYGEEFFKEYIAPHGCRCVSPVHSYGTKDVISA